MKIITALSAYGRKAKPEDWYAGLPFKLYGGSYFSIRDAQLIKDDGGAIIHFYSPQEFHNKPAFTVTL